MGAAGILTLRINAREGEESPAKVVRIDQTNGPDNGLPEHSPALLLALCVFGSMSAAQKEDMRRQIRFLGRCRRY